MLPPRFNRPRESRMADNICISRRPLCLWSRTFTVSHTVKVSPISQPYLSNVRPSSLPCYKKGTPTTTLNFCPPPPAWAGGDWVPRLRTGGKLRCGPGSGRPTYIRLCRNSQTLWDSTADNAKGIGLRGHRGARTRVVVAQSIGTLPLGTRRQNTHTYSEDD